MNIARPAGRRRSKAGRTPPATTARDVRVAEFEVTRVARLYVRALKNAELSQREGRLRQRVVEAISGPIESLALRRVPEDRGKAKAVAPMLEALPLVQRRRYFLERLMRLAKVRDRMLQSAPWQERFIAVRAALREAERLKGHARTDGLVGVCRLLDDAERDPPVPWKKDATGAEWRVSNASTRAYDRAEIRLELLVSRAVGGHCPCCFADEHERRARPRRRQLSAKAKR